MKFSKWKKNENLSNSLENLELFILGINRENRKKLAKAKEENNIYLYNDILFQALLYDGKHSRWYLGL